MVFLDLKENFDMVYHSILISKLSAYGISGTLIEWFKSYIINLNGIKNVSQMALFLAIVYCPVVSLRGQFWDRSFFSDTLMTYQIVLCTHNPECMPMTPT